MTTQSNSSAVFDPRFIFIDSFQTPRDVYSLLLSNGYTKRSIVHISDMVGFEGFLEQVGSQSIKPAKISFSVTFEGDLGVECLERLCGVVSNLDVVTITCHDRPLTEEFHIGCAAIKKIKSFLDL